MTAEKVKADGIACATCAAKSFSLEGPICEPWKLGQGNTGRKIVFGRTQRTGTTMRPILCPHRESKVATIRSTQAILREQLNK